jgi:hypothetical protein
MLGLNPAFYCPDSSERHMKRMQRSMSDGQWWAPLVCERERGRERHDIYDVGKIFSVHMYIWNIILVSKFIMQ